MLELLDSISISFYLLGRYAEWRDSVLIFRAGCLAAVSMAQQPQTAQRDKFT